MKDALILDMDHSSHARRPVCGHTMFGPDMSRCPCCHQWKPLQLNGICIDCSTSSGLNPLTLLTEMTNSEDK